MVRNKKIAAWGVIIFLTVLLYVDCYGRIEVSNGLGFPKGVMIWSANDFLSYQPFDNRPFHPEILYNESFAWARLNHLPGAVSMLTASAYILGRYDLPFGQSGVSMFLSAGPGFHVLSSLASPSSPAMSTSNTEVTIKGHVIGGLKLALSNRQFLSLSVRSTFPDDSPLDCGYLSYGSSIGNKNSLSSTGDGKFININRIGISSTKDNYGIFSLSGIFARRVEDNFSVGLGMGWDCAKDVLSTPLFIDLRSGSMKGAHALYLVIDGGYSWGWIQGFNASERNGFMGFAGICYYLPYSGNNGITFELGAKTERVSVDLKRQYSNYDGDTLPAPPDEYRYEIKYKMMAVAQVGFQFEL